MIHHQAYKIARVQMCLLHHYLYLENNENYSNLEANNIYQTMVCINHTHTHTLEYYVAVQKNEEDL